MSTSYKKETTIKTSISHFPPAKQARFHVGLNLLKFLPSKAAQVEADPFRDDLSPLEKLIRNGLYARAFLNRDFATLREYLTHYWTNEAAEFHNAWQNRFERMFIPHDSIALASLTDFLAARPELQFSQVVEIGCGGGQLLNHLSERFPKVEKLVGIDLGEEQIEENKKTYAHNQRIQFITANAVEWIPQNTGPNTLFVTNGGVFEYFLKSELMSLFQHISTHCQSSSIMIIETIGSDHDLVNDLQTEVYGRELSFSHNYPNILKDHGFQIIHQSERKGFDIDGGGRWIRVVGIC